MAGKGNPFESLLGPFGEMATGGDVGKGFENWGKGALMTLPFLAPMALPFVGAALGAGGAAAGEAGALLGGADVLGSSMIPDVLSPMMNSLSPMSTAASGGAGGASDMMFSPMEWYDQGGIAGKPAVPQYGADKPFDWLKLSKSMGQLNNAVNPSGNPQNQNLQLPTQQPQTGAPMVGPKGPSANPYIQQMLQKKLSNLLLGR